MSTNMINSFLPSRFRGAPKTETPPAPGWLNSAIVTPAIQTLSRRACLHPIHTVVLVMVLASTTYLGLIESSLFDTVIPSSVGKAHWSSLLEGSRQLRLGSETGWKWQTADSSATISQDADHLALLTFVFPDSLAANSPQNAPPVDTVPLPHNLTVTALPSTSNPLALISQDSALAFSVPYSQASEFLAKSQELPNVAIASTDKSAKPATERETKEHKMWIMKAAKADATSRSVKYWALNAWTGFIDLLKNAETLDIIIMVLGYISMHLTFVSLFGSMRQMGSNFWLFATTIFSSVFAFLFGLIVTTKMGVPINMVLLSEGLPFLVVTIGFEKAITLTRAVLSAALDTRRPVPEGSPTAGGEKKPATSIQHAVRVAISEKGFDIVRDYAIEICILVAGAASGVQGGLQQFCFLAAWILFFDCILLFTFYTAILSIKLEINRMKRHVAVAQALEDDGISRRVAENVAQSNEWPRADGPETNIFGSKVKSSSIPKFKALMVSGFILINIFNLFTIQLRGGKSNAELPSVSGFSGHGFSSLTTAPPLDPFKVASNGLDAIYEAAKSHNRSTVVTVLTPIKYELEYPSVYYTASTSRNDQHALGTDESAEVGNYGMSGRVVDSLLKSLEDPILSKWIIMALVLSVVLNGYLFNAARWSIKEPLHMPPHHPVDPVELQQAENFNNSINTPASTLQLAALGGRAEQPLPTPVTTDDEEDIMVMRPPATKQPALRRSPAELEKIILAKRVPELTDEEIVDLSLQGKIAGYALERTLKDCTRAVKIRRAIIARTAATSETTDRLERSLLPYENYNYDQVLGACCENVIGYMPLPVGVAGPFVIDKQTFFIPMATTEGVLVASASRGMKAINSGGGAVTILTNDGMTRGPCISFETLERAGAALNWLNSEYGQSTMAKAFNSTTRFGKLVSIKTGIAGRLLYPRFRATTGDAMGMNMISKGVEHALSVMAGHGFEDMYVEAVSGNYCTDKKAAAINWIEGRGKGVVAEATIPANVVKSVLKSNVKDLVRLCMNKNFVGSALAGTLGGNNAHAANLVAAIFIATGQDPAQVVESSNCMTIFEESRSGDLQISVTMPSIEVGTLGGGTILAPQGALLDMLGVRGSHPTAPGENAQRLARIIAASVLAGELSLMSALAAGHLVQSHMAHNRSAPASRSTTPAPSGSQTPITSVINTSLARAGLTMTSSSNLSAAAVNRAGGVKK